MSLSIVMPTIPGREDELERTMRVYNAYTPEPIEWLVLEGFKTCGAAWNRGVKKCSGDIVHMGADDIEPTGDSWFPAAMKAIERGKVPLGFVYEHGSCIGGDFCRIVICRREWWVDVIDAHYFSDNDFTDLMRESGHWPEWAPGFNFLHRKSMVGRDESAERLARDEARYQEAVRNRQSSSTVEIGFETYEPSSGGLSEPDTNDSSS